MKIGKIISISFFVLLNLVSAQEPIRKPIFVAAHAGVFKTNIDYFKNRYESDLMPCVGFGLGMPLPKSFYLTGKASYFAKTGTPLVTHYTLDSQGMVIGKTETREGTEDFSQWLINAGIAYEISINELYALAFTGGVSFTKISEKVTTKNYSYDIKTDGLFGYFVGAGCEYKFSSLPLGIFIDGQYSFTKEDVEYFFSDLGGINTTVGIKYYLKKEKQK